ncbi:DUF6161 domain-containing protein [Aeromonas salmonicida]|uniref:DUF6161 domain-containing protein n=1 Tax=Aeromonas salmonicida TaxID=645 RepID=UPI00223FBC65|nr:DUF6161 domain-containing protein [Aeromonas salmonicida]
MDEQVSDGKFSIPLGDGKGEKLFLSFEQYSGMVREEREYWKWIGGRLEHPLNYLQDFVRSKCIDSLLLNIDAGNVVDQIRVLNSRQKQWLPIYSFTPEGQYIKSIYENYGQIIGFFALLHITDLTHQEMSNLARQNNHFADMLKIYAVQNAIAVNLVMSFEDKFKEQAAAYENSVKQMYKQFELTLASVEKKLSSSVEEHNERVSEIIERYESLYTKARKRFKLWSARCLSGINGTRLFAKKTFNESKADIKQAAAAYHEQVDLDASVSYWKSKKTRNNRNAFIWFVFGIGGSVGATFYLLAKYYAKGGIIGISASLADTGASGGEVANQLQSVAATATSGMEHLVFNTTGAALVVTLMAVIIRVALRQFNTYSHLSLEAEERVTMVKTYLALLNEGKLKSDQDRHLALEALFRTSQTGMIAETSFNSPVDIIVKSLADKAKV